MLIFLLVLLVLAAAACGYWFWLKSHYAVPDWANEIHRVTCGDLWTICLWRYRNEGKPGEPVLLCHGFGGNRFNFTYPREACIVNTLVQNGYDCWVIELRGCRSSKPPFGRTRNDATADDYVNQDLAAAIQAIRRATGYERVHWVGHSMGGMLLYAYQLSFGTAHLASGTTLASPPGFEGVPYGSPKALLFLLQYARPVLNTVTRALTPLLTILKPKVAVFPVNYENLHPKADGRLFFNVIELPAVGVAGAFDFWVANKVWTMDSGRLDVAAGLGTLTVPLLAIYGKADPLVPLANAESFFNNLPGKDKKMIVFSEEAGHAADYSHGDLAFAVKGPEEVYTPIAKWLAAHKIREHYDPDLGKDEPKHALDVEVAVCAPPEAGKPETTQEPADSPPQEEQTGKTEKPVAKKKRARKPVAKKAVTKKKSTSKKKVSTKKKPRARKPVAKKPAAKKKTTAKKKPAAKKKTTPKKKTRAGKPTAKRKSSP